MYRYISVGILVVLLGLSITEAFPNVKNYIVITVSVLICGFLFYLIGKYSFEWRGNRCFNAHMVEVDYMDASKADYFLKPLFEAYGYNAEVIVKDDNMGGNLILSRKGIKTEVQAVCYGTNIDDFAIQQALERFANYKDSSYHKMIVSNSYFTKQAKKCAKKARVKLIDRDGLIEMVTYDKERTKPIAERLLALFNLRIDRD